MSLWWKELGKGWPKGSLRWRHPIRVSRVRRLFQVMCAIDFYDKRYGAGNCLSGRLCPERDKLVDKLKLPEQAIRELQMILNAEGPQ